MALQIWLPLCKEGDFLNKGLADITVTNNGAAYDTNGKIGGCYKVWGKNIRFSSFSFMEMKHGNSFSLFNWVKGTTNGWLYACNAFEVRFRPDYISIHNGPDVSNYSARYYATFDTNTWHHLGFTWDGSEDILRLYLNGVLVALDKKSTIISYTINSTFNISYDGPRYINDFRIYNHCLSPKEVKEISKGLVLHYPLNSIISNTIYDCSGYCNNGTIIGSLTTSDDTPRYDKCINLTSPGYHKNATYNYLESNMVFDSFTELTLSLWYKASVYNRGGFVSSTIFNYNDYLNTTFNSYDSFIACRSNNNTLYNLSINNVIKDGTWHHYVIISTGLELVLYRDGIAVQTLSTDGSGLKGFTKLAFNFSYAGGCRRSATCLYSDIRLYVTAIDSDKDSNGVSLAVKELYNTSAMIDNLLNLSAYSFNETSENNISKSGILNSNLFIEDSNAEIYEDKTKANQIIEI